MLNYIMLQLHGQNIKKPQLVYFKLFYTLFGFVYVLLLVYFFSTNISLVGQDSKNLFETSQSNNSTQEDQDPKDNKPKECSKQKVNNTIKYPVYPHTPVKVYINASLSKSNITKDFKDVSIIYMWFNKTTGKVYIGSAINGFRRLATYYLSSIRKKSLI